MKKAVILLLILSVSACAPVTPPLTSPSPVIPLDVVDAYSKNGNGNVQLSWTYNPLSDSAGVEISSPLIAPIQVNYPNSSLSIPNLANETLYQFTLKTLSPDGTRSPGVTIITRPSSKSLTVHYKRPSNWPSDLRVFSWVDVGLFRINLTGNSPGTAMTYYGNGWYTGVISGDDAATMIIGNGLIQTGELLRTGEGWYENGQWFDLPPTSYKPDIESLGTLKITELGGHYYYNSPTWFEVTNTHPTESAQLSRYHLRSYYIEQGSPPTSYQPEIFSLPSLVIPPGSYALIRGQYDDELTPGGMTVFVLKDGIRTPYWDNTGGHLELLSGAQSTGFQTADSIRFGFDTLSSLTPEWTGGALPEFSDTPTSVMGYSYSRSPLNGDTNTAADWILTPWATPGGPNDVPAGAVDGDVDGIPDTSEMAGGTFAGLPLYDWGARTGRKDIFIHVDFMDQTDRIIDEGIIPHKDALTKVVATFGAKNIAIHFDTGDLYAQHQLLLPSQDPSSHKVPFSLGTTLGKEAGLANVYDYKNNSLPEARRQIFHYLLFGNTQQASGNAGSSGLGELRGNDFLVTLGKWGLSTIGNSKFTPDEKYWELVNIQASTIMHELGHNLGLHHGGGESLNYKPNYISVMNYLYQISGLPVIGSQEGDRYYWGQYVQKDDKSPSSLFFKYFKDGYQKGILRNEYESGFIMDFSHGTAATLKETSISETQGLGSTGSLGVDYNGDGDTTDVGILKDTNLDSKTTDLADYDDWSNLILDFQHTYESDRNGSTRSLTPTRRLMLENDTQEIVPEYDHPISRE